MSRPSIWLLASGLNAYLGQELAKPQMFVNREGTEMVVAVLTLCMNRGEIGDYPETIKVTMDKKGKISIVLAKGIYPVWRKIFTKSQVMRMKKL